MEYSHFVKASALLLWGAVFPVRLWNCSFTDNRFNVGELLNTNTTADALPEGAPYESREGVLQEGVVCLHEMEGYVELLSNNFTHNGGTKGPVVIALSAPTALAVIKGNRFSFNTGILSAAALSLFSQTSSPLFSSSGSFCGGFHLSSNFFLGNSVLYKGGIVRHECSRSDLVSLNYRIFH